MPGLDAALVRALRTAAREEQHRRHLRAQLAALPREMRYSQAELLLVSSLAEHLRTGPLHATFDELTALAQALVPELGMTPRRLRRLLLESSPVQRNQRFGLVKLRRNLWTHTDTLRRYGLDPTTARHSLTVARRLLDAQARQQGLDRLRALAGLAAIAQLDEADEPPLTVDRYATRRRSAR